MQSEMFNRIGIVGAGTMGSRIAYQCVRFGKTVYLYDVAEEMLEQARLNVLCWLDERVGGAEGTQAVAHLHLCARLEDCVDEVDWIIETVPEDVGLKRRVFAELDRVAPAHVPFATNSSSIPASRLADVTTRPERVFNVNFNDPLGGIRLVEVMAADTVDPAVIVKAAGFLTAIGLVPIVTKREIMGFSFNRVWRAIKREALHLVGEGYVAFEDIDRAWMLSFAQTLGPFARMDQIGLDVIRDIEKQYYLDSGDERDKPPKFLDALISQGRLGEKTGRGFYNYPNPAYREPGWLYKEPPWDPDQAIELI